MPIATSSQNLATLLAAITIWSSLTSSAGSHYVHMAGVNCTTDVTLTTPMGPQRLHPMGEAAGGGGGGGFINQHMKLLTLLTLAIHMRVDAVLLPPATSHDSHSKANATWQPETASSLWNTESIARLLHRYGIELIMGIDEAPAKEALQLPTYFCRVLDIDVLAADIRLHLRMHLARLPKQPGNAAMVTVYAPDLLLAIRTDSLPLYAEVARSVEFAPSLTHIADGIVNRLLEMSPTGYNGLHLRVEFNKALNTTAIADGLQSYDNLIHELNFSMVPLFMAGGIFAEGGRLDVQRYGDIDAWLKQNMSANGHASFVANRRLIMRQLHEVQLSTSQVAATSQAVHLHSEQGAAVDFLVLLRSRNVVGARMSSFSFMLREFRALLGHPRNTSRVVGEPWELFRAGASMSVP